MDRPDTRPMRALPTLEKRRKELESCVFCPKLCRSACPVSNAEPKETLTPWGKMSMAYFLANESVAMAAPFASPTWACTGCYACKHSCDHENDVAGTLYEARSLLAEKGVAPEAATRATRGFSAHAGANRDGVRELSAHRSVNRASKNALLVGCAYVRRARAEAKDAIDAASALVGGEVALVDECCGLPLLMAGDLRGFAKQAERMARAIERADTLLVVDAGCAMAIRVRYAEVGVKVAPKVELVVERAAAELGRLGSVANREERVRYHDPCQLGRGLGIYDAPRAVLTRLLGRAPDEFVRNRERATCSGGGGLVPLTMPETSGEIARQRVAQHAEEGGGRIVTACASSLVKFRQAGAVADDIVSWIAKGIASP